MKDLIVVAYKNNYSAQDNMRTLRTLQEDWTVTIYDAVAVARDADGTLRLQDSYRATPFAGAGWGALLGTILGGLALAPFTAGLSTALVGGMVAAAGLGGAALGGAVGSEVAVRQKDDLGLPEDFVTGVAASIPPGHSALFALVESYEPQQLSEYFRGTSGTIIRANLSPAQQAQLQRILSGS